MSDVTEVVFAGSQVRRPRRYYLLKRLYYSRQEQDEGHASVWRSKQEAEPGTDLADDFPYRSTLVACGYSTVEDIDGADLCEIQETGLSESQAQTVLAALPSL